MDAPLKPFGQERMRADNKLFTQRDGFPFMVGQKVRGSWVDADGKTYFMKGRIDYNEKSGYWVVDDSGGITPVKSFWTLMFETEFLDA